jgi:peroxin-5
VHSNNVPARFDDLEEFEAWRGEQAAAQAAAVDEHHAHVRDDLRRLARRYREPNASAWAEEYARDALPTERDDAWAAEFVRGAAAAPAAAPEWVEEFKTELQPTAEAWAGEFQREQDAKFAQQKVLLDEYLGGTTQSDTTATTNDDNVSATSGSSSLDTRFATYEFATPNPYLNSADPFSEGQLLFRNGSLAEAILALEAAVQRAPNGIASKAAAPAWALLGQAHAENDHDDRAIACLMRAVDADNSDLSALIALGVSCANDYYRDEALNLLETWLDQHPDYRHLAGQMPAVPMPMGGGGGGGGDAWVASFERHARVTALFLRAASLKPTTPDANVQTALGLLYNLSYEFDRAADCFRAALGVQPDNYSLWNKLGATLANGNDSRAALAAYHRALALKPQYVRARANLGIAHLALGEFDGAAHHLSLALKRHGASNDEHLWNNLELVCRLMENPRRRSARISATRHC